LSGPRGGSAAGVDPTNNEAGLSALPGDPVGFPVISRTALAPLRSVAGRQTGRSGGRNSIELAPGASTDAISLARIRAPE